MDSVRWVQGGLVATLAVAAFLASGPLRDRVLAHPHRALAAIVIANMAVLVWATLPFVPNGIDESLFLTNAHHLRGVDIPVSWMRTPLPVLAITPFPDCPALPGIVAKQVAVVLVYALARPALGTGLALLAALLTAVASELERNTCQVLSEPYGAAALAGFALAVAGKNTNALFGTAIGGFLSRWQLLWMVPVAAFVTLRCRGVRAAALGILVSAGAVFAATTITGGDPWRAFSQERQRDHTWFERLLYYLDPQTSFGLGLPTMLLAVVGGTWVLRQRPRDPRLLACAALFCVYALGVMSVGIVTPRFMAPAIPLGCVLAAAGVGVVARRWPAMNRGAWGAVLVAVLVALAAIPVRAPRSRERKLQSPQAVLVERRDEVLAAIGQAPLFTDLNVYVVTAVLGRRCHAVLGPAAEHPDGISPDFDGAMPAVRREDLPGGSFYLTFDAGGRSPIATLGRLVLVRW